MEFINRSRFITIILTSILINNFLLNTEVHSKNPDAISEFSSNGETSLSNHHYQKNFILANSSLNSLHHFIVSYDSMDAKNLNQRDKRSLNFESLAKKNWYNPFSTIDSDQNVNKQQGYSNFRPKNFNSLDKKDRIEGRAGNVGFSLPSFSVSLVNNIRGFFAPPTIENTHQHVYKKKLPTVCNGKI